MKIDFNNLTNRQAFWFLVSGIVGGSFVILIFHQDYDVVTKALLFIGLNLAALCICFIVARLGIAKVRKLEKKSEPTKGSPTHGW